MKTSLFILAGLLLIFQHSTIANKIKTTGLLYTDPKTAALDSIILSISQLFDVPGVAVGIIKDGQVFYSKGFGVSNINTRNPVTTETLFKTGSVSKVITATAIMQLVELGQISLNDPIIDYLHYFKTADQNYKSLTVKHLLTHTGGIPGGYKRNYGYQNPGYSPDDIKNYVKTFSNKEFDFKPGEKYDYSNNGFVLLSALVEEISGMPFEKYAEENIFKPAGMESSTCNYIQTEKSMFADGHVIGKGFKNSVNSFFPDTRWIMGADGFYSSSDDMNKLAITLQNDYEKGTETLLKQETLKQMWTLQENGELGLCWFIFNAWGGTFIEHAGNAPGFSAEFAFYDNLAVTVLCNSDKRANWEITKAIIKSMKNIEKFPIRMNYSDSILNVFQEEGIEKGIEELESRLLQKNSNIRLRPFMFMALSILQGTSDTRLEDSQVLLETLIKNYPDNDYLHDFLGEVYFRLSLKHYEKANSISPNDWGIEKMLYQLKSVDPDFYN